jgi:hypothetical protein
LLGTPTTEIRSPSCPSTGLHWILLRNTSSQWIPLDYFEIYWTLNLLAGYGNCARQLIGLVCKLCYPQPWLHAGTCPLPIPVPLCLFPSVNRCSQFGRLWSCWTFCT